MSHCMAENILIVFYSYTKESRLEENLKADSITFTEDEMRQINQELDQIQIIGARYNAQQESLLEK